MLKYIALIPMLYKLVTAVVEQIEAVKEGIPGAEKKAAVLEALQGGWPTMQETFGFDASFEKMLPLISFFIDLAVNIYNLVKHFKKEPAPAPVV